MDVDNVYLDSEKAAMKRLFLVSSIIGFLMFFASLFLPVMPGSVTGFDTVSDWRSGALTHAVLAHCLVMIPDEINRVRIETSDDKGDGLDRFIQERYWDACQIILILMASILMLFRLFAQKIPISRWLGFVLCGLTLCGCFCLASFLFEHRKTYVTGHIHLGIGAYLWVASSLLVGIGYLEFVQKQKPIPLKMNESKSRFCRLSLIKGTRHPFSS
jgi:hypothetical protein